VAVAPEWLVDVTLCLLGAAVRACLMAGALVAMLDISVEYA
jgi:hypothetical protein